MADSDHRAVGQDVAGSLPEPAAQIYHPGGEEMASDKFASVVDQVGKEFTFVYQKSNPVTGLPKGAPTAYDAVVLNCTEVKVDPTTGEIVESYVWVRKPKTDGKGGYSKFVLASRGILEAAATGREEDVSDEYFRINGAAFEAPLGEEVAHLNAFTNEPVMRETLVHPRKLQ